MFAYEDGSVSMCGEVECCALDSGIVQFAVAGRSSCGCLRAGSSGDCDCSGMQGEVGDSLIGI